MGENTILNQSKSINLSGTLYHFDRPKVMGILNLTPDSFYDGGRYSKLDLLHQRIDDLLIAAPDFIDIGGYSTKPGAVEVPIDEEWARLQPALKRLSSVGNNVAISVDTFRAEIAKRAVDHGANLVNDVSGGNLDENMFQTIAHLQVPYVLMHMRGTPKTMTTLNQYHHLTQDINYELSKKLNALRQLGVADVIIDPGFGFAKNIAQNFSLLKHLSDLKLLECPLLVGLSRKSMIYKSLNATPDQALNGTTALNMLALQNGANMLRVHDVKAAKEAIVLFNAYQDAT